MTWFQPLLWIMALITVKMQTLPGVATVLSAIHTLVVFKFSCREKEVQGAAETMKLCTLIFA